MDTQNINELNLDKYKEITKEEKEIIQNFINEIKFNQKGINIGNNVIYNQNKIGNNDFEVYKKINNNEPKYPNNKRRKIQTIEEKEDILYTNIKKNSFQNDYDYNIFFVISIMEESFSKLKFAAFQKKGTLFSSYINYDFYLINKSNYTLKNEKFFLLLFQVVSCYPINKISINVKDEDLNFEQYEHEVYSSIDIKEGTYNFFILENNKYFSKIYINDYFSAYFDYFLDEQLDIKKTIKTDLIKTLNNEISKTKNIELSPKNILKFIEYCGKLQISPINLDNININKGEKILDKKYYISKKFIKDNFMPNVETIIISLLLKIYSKYDVDELIDLISEEECCKIFCQLFFIPPLKIKHINVSPKKEKDKIRKLKSILLKFEKNINNEEEIINLEKGIENSLDTIFENLNFANRNS